jgi:hypothetical protein
MTPKLHKVTKGDKIGKDVPFYNHMRLRWRCASAEIGTPAIALLTGATRLWARLKDAVECE